MQATDDNSDWQTALTIDNINKRLKSSGYKLELIAVWVPEKHTYRASFSLVGEFGFQSTTIDGIITQMFQAFGTIQMRKWHLTKEKVDHFVYITDSSGN